MRTVAIVQARMGSSRLPGKVLQDIGGAPMLKRVMTRLSRARMLHDIVVAAPDCSADVAIEAYCCQQGWKCSRGSELDLVDRYYQAAKQARAEVVVRITSDCQLIDPHLVDQIVTEFLAQAPNTDYLSNTYETRTYPRGLDVEVFSFAALERAWREDQDPAWREHVTPYLYRRTDLFRCRPYCHETDYSSLRWTVDTPADLQLVRCIFDYFGTDAFTWLEAIQACHQHPEWAAINHHVMQKLIDRVA